jgi:hypothetical protein
MEVAQPSTGNRATLGHHSFPKTKKAGTLSHPGPNQINSARSPNRLVHFVAGLAVLRLVQARLLNFS